MTPDGTTLYKILLVYTCGHDFEDARVLLVSNDVLAGAVEGAVVLVVGGGEVESGHLAPCSKPLLVEFLLVVRVVEVPRERQNGRVGVQLKTFMEIYTLLTTCQ